MLSIKAIDMVYPRDERAALLTDSNDILVALKRSSVKAGIVWFYIIKATKCAKTSKN